MYLSEPFLRLPITFDSEALSAAVSALPAEAWVAHPDGTPGNAAVRLITPDGGMTEGVAGSMAPTKFLRSSLALLNVFRSIDAVWGRARLMLLTPGAIVPPHVDTNFYWRKHLRIHVPITTNPEVLFTCADMTVHMAAGECWVFDTFSRHHVVNGSNKPRVHLVMDTVGGEGLWALMERARSGTAAELPNAISASRGANALCFERGEPHAIMSPWELHYHIAFIRDQVRPHARLSAVLKRLDRFVMHWSALSAQSGGGSGAADAMTRSLASLEQDLMNLGGQDIILRNDLPLYRQIAELIFNLRASLPAPQMRVDSLEKSVRTAAR